MLVGVLVGVVRSPAALARLPAVAPRHQTLGERMARTVGIAPHHQVAERA